MEIEPSQLHIQENITLSEKHDGLNITCSATYPVNEGRDTIAAKRSLTLDVSCKTLFHIVPKLMLHEERREDQFRGHIDVVCILTK